MVLARLVRAQPLLNLPTLFPNDLVSMLVGGAAAFLLSYLFIFVIIYVYRRSGWVRPVEPGRTPSHTARLGGVGIYLAFVIASLLFYLPNPALNACGQASCEKTSYWLFLVASTLIVAVHAYDDLKPMRPLPKLLAQSLAVLIVLGPFIDGMFHGVLLFGFSNPFQAAVQSPNLVWYRQDIITLFINSPVISLLAIPAVLLTWFWMVGMMNTVNWIDGVDGLSGGVVAITGISITIISWTLGQHTISILAAVFTGATIGFLPHNWNPAKIYMGDSGSQFLGLGLAVLSIIGGAKVALALMVMGIPILNVAMVIINRIRRGQSPLHYDLTHLHDRLRATGLNARQICYVFYSFTAIFGILALWFVHVYKLLGIALVILTMALLVYWLDYRQRQREVATKKGPGGDDNSNQKEPALEVQAPLDPLDEATEPRFPATPQPDAPLSGSAAVHADRRLLQ